MFITSRVSFPLHIACTYGKKKTIKDIADAVPVRVLETKDKNGRTPLIICIAKNNLDSATILLKSGVHVNNSDSSGQTALHIAAHKGFHRSVKLLLSYKAYILQKDFFGVTPLHLAAINKNTKCLSLLLKEIKPGEVDIQDSSKKTALHWSASYLNLENTKALLLKGSNICIPDDGGQTPLHWAAISPKPEALKCIKILLDKEGSLINWQDYEGRTALHLAIATGSTEVVRFLACREDCNVDVPDNSFCTPLHWASKRGYYDKVDVLLNAGASFSSVDGNLASPLHYAAFKDYSKTVEVFLARNYVNEKDVRDEDGRSPLIWAAAQNADKVVNYMAEKGVNLIDGDPYEITALHAAAVQGHLSTIQLLLKLNVHIDLKDIYGMTPLLRACEFGRSKTVQFLLNNGADIHLEDANKRTAVHWCALDGHAYICQILLQKGAKPSAKDVFKMTPLHYACMKNGFLNCVSVLLEFGVDVNCVDIEGKTPLHWAVKSNHKGVIRLLCEYDANINAMALKTSWETPLDVAINKGCSAEVITLLKSYGALTSKEVQNIAASKIQACYHNYKYKSKGNFKSFKFNRTNDLLSNSDILRQCQEIIEKSGIIDKVVPPVLKSLKKLSQLLHEDSLKNSNLDLKQEENNFNSKVVPPVLKSLKKLSQLLHEDCLKNINPDLKQEENNFNSKFINLQPKQPTFMLNTQNEAKDELTNSAILRKCQQNIELFKIDQNNGQLPEYFKKIESLEKKFSNFSSVFESSKQNLNYLNKSYFKVETINDVKIKAATIIQKAWRKHAMKNKFKSLRRNIQNKFQTDEARRSAEILWYSNLQNFYYHW